MQLYNLLLIAGVVALGTCLALLVASAFPDAGQNKTAKALLVAAFMVPAITFDLFFRWRNVLKVSPPERRWTHGVPVWVIGLFGLVGGVFFATR